MKQISFPTPFYHKRKIWILEINWLFQVPCVSIGRQRLNPRFHNSYQWHLSHNSHNNYRIISNEHLNLITTTLKCNLFLLFPNEFMNPILTFANWCHTTIYLSALKQFCFVFPLKTHEYSGRAVTLTGCPDKGW